MCKGHVANTDLVTSDVVACDTVMPYMVAVLGQAEMFGERFWLLEYTVSGGACCGVLVALEAR